VNRKRCGRIKYIARKNRICRLIHNFAGGMLGALFGGFAPPAAWQTTAVFFIVVNSFRKKTTFSVKVSTFLVNCQLIQEIDCQLHQEKSNKLSTKIRKRHRERQKVQKFKSSKVQKFNSRKMD
jgi:hypothetical protein